jgi:hypothetical protein
MEHLVEWELARETEVLGKKLPQCHCATNSTSSELGWNPGRRGGRLSYGTASDRQLLSSFIISLYMPGSVISVKPIVYTHVNLILRHVLIKW